MQTTHNYLYKMIYSLKGWLDKFGFHPSVEELELPALPSKGLIQSQPWSNVIRAKYKAIRLLYYDSQTPAMWIQDLFSNEIRHFATTAMATNGETDFAEVDTDIDGYEDLLANEEDADEFHPELP